MDEEYSKHKKDAVDEGGVAKKVLPHLHPLVLQFHKKKSLIEVVGRNNPKDVVPEEVAEDTKECTTKDVVPKEVAEATKEDELYSTKEDEFYSNFCPKEDDLWRALDEEIEQIEQFLSKK